MVMGKWLYAMIWKLLDGRCGVKGCILYYSFVCKKGKTMSFESASKNLFTWIPANDVLITYEVLVDMGTGL